MEIVSRKKIMGTFSRPRPPEGWRRVPDAECAESGRIPFDALFIDDYVKITLDDGQVTGAGVAFEVQVWCPPGITLADFAAGAADRRAEHIAARRAAKTRRSGGPTTPEKP